MGFNKTFRDHREAVAFFESRGFEKLLDRGNYKYYKQGDTLICIPVGLEVREIRDGGKSPSDITYLRFEEGETDELMDNDQEMVYQEENSQAQHQS